MPLYTERQKNQLRRPGNDTDWRKSIKETRPIGVNPCKSVASFSHLNFKVVSANRAKTSEAIQKRTMIFDSDQPSSSK